MALLVPAPEARQKNLREVIAALSDFHRGRTLGGITIRELIEEGRRY